MYAIVQSGGHQYRVSVGETLNVELLEVAPGDSVTIDQVLMVSGDGDTRVGRPFVEGARVVATVVGEAKGQKLTVYKYKPKNRYKIKTGHRQRYTRLKIEDIKL
jgi:large subunit ribosomal protein L21